MVRNTSNDVMQTWCANCGGNDPVSYDWTFEPGRASNFLDENFDYDTYAVIDPVDYSIVVDSMAFVDVTEEEPYAFVLTGTYLQLYTSIESVNAQKLSCLAGLQGLFWFAENIFCAKRCVSRGRQCAQYGFDYTAY